MSAAKCELSARCPNKTTAYVVHPVMGAMPCCYRCAVLAGISERLVETCPDCGGANTVETGPADRQRPGKGSPPATVALTMVELLCAGCGAVFKRPVPGQALPWRKGAE